MRYRAAALVGAAVFLAGGCSGENTASDAGASAPPSPIASAAAASTAAASTAAASTPSGSGTFGPYAMGSKQALPDGVELQVIDIRSAAKGKVSFVMAVTNKSTKPLNLASIIGITYGPDPYGEGLDALHVIGQKPEFGTTAIPVGATAKQIYLVGGSTAQRRSVYLTFAGVDAAEVIQFRGSLNP